ncbi:MAG: hypothetical protein KGH72_04685 [Candidatus Micrarchaeota archaeon]|nr:hypothetical protein [Candidatus Micrarchaeota archaeon]
MEFGFGRRRHAAAMYSKAVEYFASAAKNSPHDISLLDSAKSSAKKAAEIRRDYDLYYAIYKARRVEELPIPETH